MINKILSPVFFVSKTFSTISNVYLAGQVGFWAYKKIRVMYKEKMHSEELKARFVEEYKLQHGGDLPSEELVSAALKAYNAVEFPLTTRIKKAIRLQ